MLVIDPLFQALVQAALSATDAVSGWLVVRAADGPRIAAAAGERAGDLLEVSVPLDTEIVGLVMASGQPASQAAHADGSLFAEDIASLLGWKPRAVLCTPCVSHYDVLGALVLVDKHTESSFSIHDLELAGILGGLAGVALAHGSAAPHTVPEPGELAAELGDLAREDPVRYASVATMMKALLSHG
ncbi:MAG: hypothetical protein NVS4B2_23600 [Chloroflexota bacterium]